MHRPSISARRTEGKRLQGRSARVLGAVLDAGLEELGRVGYAALRIEDIASLSGVNKTTIYRRWPTKLELVAAILSHAKEPPSEFDMGSLEADVRASLFEMRERLNDPRHRAILRVVMAERTQPEVQEIVSDLRERFGSVRRLMFERAIDRGELPIGTDTRALLDFMQAPLISRMVHQDLPVDDEYLEFLTQVVSVGAKAVRSGVATPAHAQHSQR
jgi:AcrR family transcriptional regulator